MVDRFADMHCHMSFSQDCHALMGGAQHDGVTLFSNTVLPSEFVRFAKEASSFENVRVGLGLHPWWVARGQADEAEVALFEQLAAQARFVGEIGLDFGRRFIETREAQIEALRRALGACARAGACRVMSFHSSSAAGVVMDEVERAGIGDVACVFHWFSGSSDELTRARDAGWYFSVGKRMLATKRGRAYLQAIPAHRLLLETDLPSSPGSDIDYDAYYRNMLELAQIVAAERGEDVLQLAWETSCELLELER